MPSFPKCQEDAVPLVSMPDVRVSVSLSVVLSDVEAGLLRPICASARATLSSALLSLDLFDLTLDLLGAGTGLLAGVLPTSRARSLSFIGSITVALTLFRVTSGAPALPRCFALAPSFCCTSGLT